MSKNNKHNDSSQDENMEAFFRQSMDQFDDGPSDKVWDNVSQRLDDEDTFFNKMWKKLGSILPYLLFFFIAGSIGTYSYYTVSQLKEENRSLENEKSELIQWQKQLKIENGNLNQKNTNLSNQLANLKKEMAAQVSTSYETLSISLQECKNNNNHLSEKIAAWRTSSSPFSSFRQSTNPHHAGTQGSASPNNNFSNNNLSNNILPSNNINSIHSKIDLEKQHSKINLNISTLDMRSLKEIKNSLKKEIAKESSALSKETKEHKAKANSRYRFGLTARTYTLYIPSGATINMNNSFGFIQEFALNHRWSINSSLQYNDQTYRVNADQGVLSQASLLKFPDNPGAYAQVKGIEARSKYFDAHLGFKYNFITNRKRTQFFINPSLVWQLYLPQEFTYTLIQAQDLLVEKKYYKGYLGSVNLSLGMEKRITNKMDFQLSLYMEHSLIELGFDNQLVRMFGIRTSVLFRK